MQSPHSNVISALKSSGLWGTIVPTSFKPSVFLQIEFKDATVELGNSIEVGKAQDEPKVGFVSNEPTNEEQDSHLLLLIDPDAPSRDDPKWGPFLHWIQPGLKPLSIDEIASVADTGEGPRDDAVWVKKDAGAKVDYLGPAPPQGTGPHRYVYLLYRQPQPQEEISLPKSCPKEIKEMGDRKQFDFEKFVEINKLELVGINFHTSEAK